MSSERIDAALALAPDTRTIRIGAGLLRRVAEVFAQSFGDRGAVVVADGNTWQAAGREVQDHLVAGGRQTAEPYVFPGRPMLYGEYGNIETLREAVRPHDAIPVAVGSGTLNDIVKRAAHELDRPYLCVPTGASVDGYTGFGAAITKDGYKQTLPCPAPRAVLVDLDVLTRAPAYLTQAGYGDLLAKVPAGADWLIADAVQLEPIDTRAWSIVQEPLREATGHPAELHAGDPAATEGLVEGLMLSGLAMQVSGQTRPASGAEHLFSHLWELEGLAHGVEGKPPPSHGNKVGVGTVAIAALYERLLDHDLAAIDIDARRRAWPSWEQVESVVQAAHTTPGLAEAAVRETRAKYVDADGLADRLTMVRDRWPQLGERIRTQLQPAEQLHQQLRAAGCPADPEDIGLSVADLRATYTRARMMRYRYTVLDLAHETGVLDRIVEELFEPGGFWARHAAAHA